MFPRRCLLPPMIALTAPLLLASCGGTTDQRLAEMAQQNVQQQAKQNEQVAEQSRQITEATKELVAADAKARADALRLQREIAEREAASRQALQAHQLKVETALQQQRTIVDRQRDVLEQERKQIAVERHREPILAAVITTFGLLLAALLPLILCGYLLHGMRNRGDEDEAAVCELLINELADDQSPLLGHTPPRVLEHRPDALTDSVADGSVGGSEI